MEPPQLLICGSIALDRIMNFSGRYRDLIKPDKLHVLSVSVLLEKMEETPGGTAANIAFVNAQLGDRPVLIGSVGPDAAKYLERLVSAGINVDSVYVSQLPTASFNVMTDSEDNQVGGFYPGAMSDAARLTLRPWISQNVFVCVSAHDPLSMGGQVDECREYGLRLMYDPGQQVSNSPAGSLQAGIDAAEVLMANDYELSVLCEKTGTTPEALKAKIPIVITTYGKEGSTIEGSKVETPIKIAATTPARTTDPTGAGDAYRAGFLYGYLRQWPLQTCGQLGSVTASFIVEHHGTQTELSREEITKRYKETFNGEITL